MGQEFTAEKIVFVDDPLKEGDYTFRLGEAPDFGPPVVKVQDIENTEYVLLTIELKVKCYQKFNPKEPTKFQSSTIVGNTTKPDIYRGPIREINFHRNLSKDSELTISVPVELPKVDHSISNSIKG